MRRLHDHASTRYCCAILCNLEFAGAQAISFEGQDARKMKLLCRERGVWPVRRVRRRQSFRHSL